MKRTLLKSAARARGGVGRTAFWLMPLGCRRKTGRKAVIHTIEALIAAMLVLSFIIFVLPLFRFEDVAEQNRLKAENALGALYTSGTLRPLAIAGNFSEIKTSARALLPSTLDLTVGNCTLNCTTLDSLPSDVAIVSASIVVAGVNATFAPVEVLLYVW